jgi:hypothetical protein
MELNWVYRVTYTQAETDTHRYLVTRTVSNCGVLRVWRFDDKQPYGRKLIHVRRYPTTGEAQRSAEIIAEHAAK